MTLSTIFQLIKRQLKENYQFYLISAAVLLGLLSFLFLLIHQWRDSFSGAVQNGVFLIGLFVSGGIITNSMFQEFADPSKAMWFLGIPAKQAEKIVATILMSTVAFLIVYIGIYYLVDWGYVLLTYKKYGSGPLNLFKNGFYYFLFTYLTFNGIVLLGSILFSKHSFIKTILATILGFVIQYHLNDFMLELMIPEVTVTSSMPLGGFQFVDQGENVYVSLPEGVGEFNDFCVRYLLPLLLWSIAWLRLKEKEV